MKLGNTGGNNKGKKYLIIKGDEPITQENQEKADAFNFWFEKVYSSLKRQISSQDQSCDDEVFHETYLRIVNKILHGGLEIKDYASYFHRSYFTNKIQIAIKENRFVDFDLERVQRIDESEENIEIMKKQDDTIQAIKDFVKEHYPNDYDLFISNMIDRITYPDLSVQTGLKEYVVQRKVSAIKNALRNEFANISLPHKNKHTSKPTQIVFKQKDEYVPQVELVPKDSSRKSLSDYPAVDLMKELYSRGYTGTLSFTQTIDISTIAKIHTGS
ncbi:MAG: hypothetical protein ACK5M3_09265 [Dysgonomonas sp.]